MRRYKFENLLKAFLISKQQYCLSIIDGKKWDEEVEVENLLIAFMLNRQRKTMSSQNLPECAFYSKYLPECAFSHKKTLRCFPFTYIVN